MKYLFALFFFFTAIITSAQVNQFDANGKRHGHWRGSFEDSGRVRYEGTFEHGRETGIFTYYDNTKAHPVIATRDFSKGPDSAWAIYYDQRKNIVSQGMLSGKVPTGKWVYYHKASKDTMTVEHYSNGKLHGERIVFYPNKALAEEAHYKNGVLHGPYKKYSAKGDVLEDVNYVNGKIEGPAVYRDGAGNLASKGSYKDGRKDGLWEIYRNGKLIKTEKHPLVRKFEKRPAKKP